MTSVFAIETSCDDTSVWLVDLYDWNIISKKLKSYSQIKEHLGFWWVVPEIASRLHNEKIISLISSVWIDAIKSSEFISVTAKPGLPWSLLVWKTAANFLWEFFWKKVIYENHIHWHIFSIFLDRNIKDISLPAVFLTASWWHNDVYVLTDKSYDESFYEWIFSRTKLNNGLELIHIWKTIDDAAWECFDKVSKMLWWPYPWWPWISEMAKKWTYNEDYYIKPVYLNKNEFNFSFSWFKSKIFYLLKEIKDSNLVLDESIISDIAFSFQESVIKVLSKKLISAWKKYNAKALCIVWGVSSNDRLYEYLDLYIREKSLDFELFRPAKKVYSTDNASMIAAASLFKNFL